MNIITDSDNTGYKSEMATHSEQENNAGRKIKLPEFIEYFLTFFLEMLQ